MIMNIKEWGERVRAFPASQQRAVFKSPDAIKKPIILQQEYETVEQLEIKLTNIPLICGYP